MKGSDAINAVASVLSRMTDSERQSLAAMLSDRRIGENQLHKLVKELADKVVRRQMNSRAVAQKLESVIDQLRGVVSPGL